MQKKNWNKPHLSALGLELTQTEICYCEAGEMARHGKPNGGGHPHKPGHPCPDKPVHKPVHPLPDGNEEDWIVSTS